MDVKRQLPNAVSIAGYAAGLKWISGGSDAYGLASIIADEVDGRLARATDAESDFGREIDYSVDCTLTGLAAMRLFNSPYPLLIVTPLQAYFRAVGIRPTIGSWRAWMMLATMLVERGGKRKKFSMRKAFELGAISEFEMTKAYLKKKRLRSR